MSFWFRRLLFIIALGCCFDSSAPAQDGSFEAVALSYHMLGTICVVVDGTLAGAGLLTFGLNVYSISKEQRPSRYLITGGYLTGFFNLVMGIVSLGCQGDHFSEKINNSLLGLGIANLVVGVLDIGTTIWAGEMPEGDEASAMVGPVVIRDTEGNPGIGIVLRVVGW